MAIVGLLAIFGLQYVWLVNTYKLAKESIQFRSNEVFKDASMQELFHRMEELKAALSFVEIPVKTALDTAPVPTVPTAMTPVAVIRSGRLTLELSNDISESLLCRLLQEVLHA